MALPLMFRRHHCKIFAKFSVSRNGSDFFELQKKVYEYTSVYIFAFDDPLKDINGRALMRLNDEKLSRIGVDHPNHRYEILNEILKQVYMRICILSSIIFL